LKTPPTPSDEKARLQALQGLHILDTETGATFDSVVQLASTLCGMPMAAISLLDSDRQWFLATVGLGARTETAREISFCGHVVGDAQAMVVADTHADERFRDNPLVTAEPHVRFYAGVPLTTQGGYRLGTLCVLDSKPGTLSAAQCLSLEQLARLTMRLIEARGSEAGRAESEQRFQAMADSAPVMVWMSDSHQQITYANLIRLRFTGLTLEQLCDGLWQNLVHPEDLPGLQAVFSAATQSERGFRHICRMRNAVGEYHWLQTEAEPRFNADGKFIGHIGSDTDVTEERNAREEMQLAEERLRLIVDGTDDSPWDWDLRRDEMYYSPRWWATLGMRPNEVPADSGLWQRLMHPDDVQTVTRLFQSVYEDGENGFAVEFRMRHRDGHYVPVLCRGRVLRDDQNVPMRVAGTNTDLTVRRRAEEARNQARNLLAQVAARVPGVVYQYRVRPDGSACFPYASDAIRQIYRVAPEDVEHDASLVMAVLHPEDREQIGDSIETSRTNLTPWDCEYRVRYADGTVRWLHGNALPQRDADGSVLWHGFITDCTARKDAEQERESLSAQLREAQKMQAIGTLAGGIAHDFNNITGVILGNAELARQDLGDNPSALESLAQIRAAAERARDLTRQILSFSRRQPTTRRTIRLQPRIEKVLQLLRSTLLTPSTIHCHFEPDIPLVCADQVQLDQVLINLLTNAAQAMGGQPGRIDVRVDSFDDPVSPEPDGAARPPARFARIRISDTGQGMNEAQLRRIFEPFYTTKPVDEGTGLGLSVVYGIVHAHDGRVSADSVPGQGSTFTVLFPAASGELEAGGPKTAQSIAGTAARHQHILYVDDDESLLFLCKRLLERSGYRVTTANSGDRGLALLHDPSLELDLLLTDYNMPGMTGLELARHARELKPQLPIAIASGFITDELRAQAAELGVHDLVFKPNVVQEYCDVVDRLLGIDSTPH
jgi:PAS domain S-box-containing protein